MSRIQAGLPAQQQIQPETFLIQVNVFNAEVSRVVCYLSQGNERYRLPGEIPADQTYLLARVPLKEGWNLEVVGERSEGDPVSSVSKAIQDLLKSAMVTLN